MYVMKFTLIYILMVSDLDIIMLSLALKSTKTIPELASDFL